MTIRTMVKADRYTADGCEELNKAREADVEDRRYNVGEISEKTGLQKTANGWVKPKSGKQPGVKSDKTTPEEKAQIKELKTQYASAKTDEERRAIANKVNEIMGVNERMSPATEKQTKNTDGYKYWKDRSKGERTATLIDWLDDWDKEDPNQKKGAAYTAIEEELKSRGVSRENRATAKEADNKERNEFYRRAYEGDAAPRVLTGDTRIRVRKA